jgi:hypothetical protein
MLLRPIITPPPPTEAEIDTPEMIEAALAAQRDEADVLVLIDVVEIGMRLMRGQEAYATARLAAASAEGAALNPGEDPTAAFNKLAQAVRRTIALRKHLGDEIKTRRSGLAAERAARRARRAEDHKEAVNDAIELALSEISQADLIYPDLEPGEPDPHEIERQEMLADTEMLLEDVEEFGDWLNRPVGETVVKLCATLGLDPGDCVKRGDTWFVRRAPTPYETRREARNSKSIPPLHGEGQDAKRPGWGTLDEVQPSRSP